MHTLTCNLAVEPQLRDRLLRLSERTGDNALRCLANGHAPDGAKLRSDRELNDWIDTCAMDAFRRTRDEDAFSLLYERNSAAFLRAIHGHLRGGLSRGVSEHDVLQESFLAIYRYPLRFSATRADAFRNWSYRILRNTALRQLHASRRLRAMPMVDEDPIELMDERERAPDRVAMDRESAAVVDRAYVLALAIYMQCFEELSPRAKRVLIDVDIERRPYRAIAAELGCAIVNIKMAVFRARRTISRRITRVLAAS